MDFKIHKFNHDRFANLMALFFKDSGFGVITYDGILGYNDLLIANIQDDVASKLTDEQKEQLRALIDPNA